MAEVVGANAQRIRVNAGLTLDRVATAGRTTLGVGWTDSSVASIERGDFRPTVQVLVALAQTLGDLTESPIRLTDLVDGSAHVALSDELAISPDALKRALQGDPIDLRWEDVRRSDETRARVRRTIERIGPSTAAGGNSEDLASRRAARRLGIDTAELTRRSQSLWGHSMTAERDRRLPAGASAQQLGAVTRELIRELTDG